MKTLRIMAFVLLPALGLFFAPLPLVAGPADGLNTAITDLRDKIAADPSKLPTMLVEIEARIAQLPTPEEKGRYLVRCAAGLYISNVQTALPDVGRLANEALKYPLETEDAVKAQTLAGDAAALMHSGD